MRRKYIIATCCIAIVLSIALCCYGVYASLNQTFSVSNKIGFQSDENIYVALECSVSGSVQSNYEQAPEGFSSLQDYRNQVGIDHKVYFEEDMRGGIQDLNSADNKWNITESLIFVDSQTPIIYTIRIFNYSSKAIKVSFSSYVSTSDNLNNVISESVIIDGFIHGEQPQSKVITLTSNVKNATRGFSNVNNDFNIIFEINE